MSAWKDAVARLPREIRLDGWLGPTLFTSETTDGELATLEAFCSALAGHEHARAWVIGTVRETQGASTAYAAFCIDPRTEAVVLVDLDPPHNSQFVNRSVEALGASLDVFVSMWPRLAAADDGTATRLVRELQARLEAIDTAANLSGDAYWPTVLETYEH